MRGPHVEKRTWTYHGKPRTSDWYYLVFYVRTPRGAKRVYRRTYPPTDQKRLALEQLHRALADGAGQAPGAAKLVSAVLEAYEKHLKTNAPSTWRSRKFYLAAISETFGALRVTAFLQPQVDRLIADLERRELAESTKAAVLGLLRSAFSYAVKNDLIDPHPVAKLRIPFGYPERHVVWTAEEVRAVCDEMPAWAARYTLLMLLTGLRKGDALSLRWDQVETDRILVRQEKTRNVVRVPITEPLKKLLESFPGARVGFLFAGPRGGHYSTRAFGHHIYAAMKTARVQGKTIHDLRRTFATRAYNRGVPPAMIADLLGQRGTRLVGRYTHAEFETLRVAAELAAVTGGEPRKDAGTGGSSGKAPEASIPG